MTTGTTTKRRKGDDIYPPREIQNDTKARRAWVAAKIAELSADPAIESAKSVGIGSYQHVSVWVKITVEGRERFRGACQYCGGSHVVENPNTNASRVVMHGYKRPGDGYLIGRCPGAGNAPLNVERQFTCTWHDEFTLAVPRAASVLATAQQHEADAEAALTASGENRHLARVHEPRKPGPFEIRRDPQAVAKYEAAWKAFCASWPAYIAWRVRIDATAAARNALSYAKMMEGHFADLLAGDTFGSPLEREIVP